VLGVGKNPFSVELLQQWTTSPGLYLVDPFIHIWKGYDEPDWNLSDKDHQMVFEDLRTKLQPYQNKYSLVRDFSTSFAVTYKQTPGSPPTSLVFLDANPSYDSVKRDIEDWWPTLTSGGILAGSLYDRPSVRKAVHEHARLHNLKVGLFLEPNTWFVLKAGGSQMPGQPAANPYR